MSKTVRDRAGEAMVVTQSAILLATDVAVIVCCVAVACLKGGTPTSLGLFEADDLQTALGPRNHVHVFVELLVFGTLCVAFVAVQLMWSIPGLSERGRAAVQKPANRGRAPLSDIIADSSSLQSGKAEASRVCGEGNLGTGKLSSMGLEGWLLILLVSAAAALAVRPALWVLEFAAASPRRIAVLGYWVSILAVALPGMDWLSRSSGLPTIIVRKVSNSRGASCRRRQRSLYRQF